MAYMYIILCYRRKKHIAIWWKEVRIKPLEWGGRFIFIALKKRAVKGEMCIFGWCRMWKFLLTVYCVMVERLCEYASPRELEFIFYSFMCKMLNWNENFLLLLPTVMLLTWSLVVVRRIAWMHWWKFLVENKQ